MEGERGGGSHREASGPIPDDVTQALSPCNPQRKACPTRNLNSGCKLWSGARKKSTSWTLETLLVAIIPVHEPRKSVEGFSVFSRGVRGKEGESYTKRRRRDDEKAIAEEKLYLRRRFWNSETNIVEEVHRKARRRRGFRDT